MRKTLVIFCAFLSLGFAAERMVLAELFTSTTCPPCVSANSQLSSLLSAKDSYLAVVRYHMYWPNPGNDPFYNHNSRENGTRRNFYGSSNINAVPKLVIDGEIQGSTGWGSTIDERHNVDSPVFMKVYRSYLPAGLTAQQGSGDVLVALTNESADESLSCNIYGALTESNISYTGTNGDPTHNQVMLDMVTDFGWQMDLEPGDTRVMLFDYSTEDSIALLNTAFDTTSWHMINADNCELVLWYQDKNTKQVIQAAKTDVVDAKELTVTDIEFVDSSGDGKLSAGEQAEIHLTVNNGESSRLDDVRAYIEIRESEVAIVSNDAYVDDISPGGSHRFEGGELAVEASADYDGSPFTLYCYAGSGDGSLGSAMQPLGIAAEPVSGYVLSLPSFALAGSTVDLSPMGMEGQVTIDLIEASGRKVAGLYTGCAEKLENIKLPDASAGLYFVRIRAASGTQTSKIVLLP